MAATTKDKDGNISEADTAEIADGADDVAAGDITAGLDDSSSLGGGGDVGEEGGEGGYGGGDGDEGILGTTGGPVAMVPQVTTRSTAHENPFRGAADRSQHRFRAGWVVLALLSDKRALLRRRYKPFFGLTSMCALQWTKTLGFHAFFRFFPYLPTTAVVAIPTDCGQFHYALR